MEQGRFLIVTGMSGAGKTQVLRTLEDLNYFVWTTCRRYSCRNLPNCAGRRRTGTRPWSSIPAAILSTSLSKCWKK